MSSFLKLGSILEFRSSLGKLEKENKVQLPQDFSTESERVQHSETAIAFSRAYLRAHRKKRQKVLNLSVAILVA